MNQVELEGYLFNDAKFKALENDNAVTNIFLVTTEKVADKEYLTYHKCTAWGKTAHATAGLKKDEWVVLKGKNKSKKDQEGKFEYYVDVKSAFKRMHANIPQQNAQQAAPVLPAFDIPDTDFKDTDLPF